MTGPVPPFGRGRHAGPETLGTAGSPSGTWYGNRAAPGVPPTTAFPLGPVPTRPGGAGRGPGVLDRSPSLSGRHSAPGGDDRTGPLPGGEQPTPPATGLPPRPSGPWSKLQRRSDAATPAGGDTRHIDTVHPGTVHPGTVHPGTVHPGAVHPGAVHPDAVRRDPLDAPTQAHPAVDPHGHHPDDHDEHHHDEHWDDEDATGGLDVIGSGRHEEGRRGRRARRAAAPHDDHDEHHDVVPGRRSRSGRRRRSPLANVLALLVLAGLVAGIVLGGRALIGLVNPEAQDFSGAGTGTVEVRVGGGDTLSDIGRTLVDQGVIASVDPFVEAAEADPASMGIQPGVYSLREQMSGQAALDLLLDPASRLVSRVTVPEGFTLEATLQRVAEATGLPIEEVRAAAADPAALGLPAYANGQLEGFLFPATYDVEPDDSAADVLRGMVGRFTEVAADLQLEQRAAASGRSVYDVVVVASMIQSETLLDEERPDVAQVVYNRLAQGIPLGIDATLAYGLGKNGNDLTVTDLQTDSPYNTRTRAGLPPTPISAPGEASLEAALAPSTGDYLYYVLASSDGRHFFTADYAEFQAARQECADAGLGCGG